MCRVLSPQSSSEAVGLVTALVLSGAPWGGNATSTGSPQSGLGVEDRVILWPVEMTAILHALPSPGPGLEKLLGSSSSGRTTRGLMSISE